MLTLRWQYYETLREQSLKVAREERKILINSNYQPEPEAIDYSEKIRERNKSNIKLLNKSFNNSVKYKDHNTSMSKENSKSYVNNNYNSLYVLLGP